MKREDDEEDDLMDFFDFSKPFKQIVIPSNTFSGKVRSEPSTSTEIVKRESEGTEYAFKYVEAEKLQILKNIEGENSSVSSQHRSFEELEDIEVESDCKPNFNKNNDEVYQLFDCVGSGCKRDLPIYNNREKILNLIKNNQVVIIEGETGCGKTTQVPQYILEDAANRKEYCNIVCTQPRRIAALSIAKRVCHEKSFQLGTVVGYQIGLHEKSSEHTRLLFCTTGILLQKLIKNKHMSQYTHIILDEIHEREQDMDFLLIIVRRLLTTVSKTTKVILMSATINSKIFSDYFTFIKNGVHIPVPVLKNDVKRSYIVQCFYINELGGLKCDLNVNYDDPSISDETYKIALKLIVVVNKIDSDSTDILPFDYLPSVLIFLPGINEIDKMDKILDSIRNNNYKLFSHIKFIVIRLHSMVSQKEQHQAFMKPPKGCRKIILATNIAESSITVPDVKYVIDFCLSKSLLTDSNTNLSSLQTHWASKANCIQRAGRAGRVMNGRVYRLVSQQFFNNYMKEHGEPEMTTCPLENICLRAKMLKFGPPHAVLALALSPPNLSDISNTLLNLKEVGALLRTINGTYDAFDGDITFIGRVMAALPLNIQISRLIIFGYIFSVLEDTIIIAAGLSVRNIFNCGQNDLESFVQKLTWSDGSGSDLIAILKAYRVWISMSQRNLFESEEAESNWARRYYINTKSIREMHLLIVELKERLEHFRIKEITGIDRVNWLDHERSIILKICISGAFYPNYFIRKSDSSHLIERDTFHTLCGFDPCNTVYFTGFDNNKYIGELYTDQIKVLFQKALIPIKNIKVRFGQGTQKIFVIFSDNSENENTNRVTLSMPGRVSTDVYKAVKMRQCGSWSDNCVKVLKYLNDQQKFAEKHGYGSMHEGRWIRKSKKLPESALVVLPSLRTRYIRGKIQHTDHCGKFWFLPVAEIQELNKITDALNKSEHLTSIKPNEIVRGMQLAALYEGKYHRVRVIHLVDTSRNRYYFKIFFIDYGNTEVVDSQSLKSYDIPYLIGVPPRVFQCSLGGIQPSTINSPNGQWSTEAVSLLQTKSDECENEVGNVRLEVYSVVNGIASVYMQTVDGTLLNDILVSQNFAQYTEENYTSKMDHDLRQRTQQIKQYEYNDIEIPDEYLHSLLDDFEDENLEKPSPTDCKFRINLRGPNSPLETTVHAAIRFGQSKTVKIERESVNSVLLDSDPQESCERLIVAGSMSEKRDLSQLIARSTTLMPNIPGYSALMCLIFCPTMEIHRDSFKTTYTSILAGLGYDTKTNKSLFIEHDMILNLDIEIIPNDIELINQIRYSMDSLLVCDIGEELPRIDYKARVALISTIKELIIKLLERPRRFIEVRYDNKEHMWNQIIESDLLKSINIYGNYAIFPLHKVMRLYNLPQERVFTLCQENQKLHKFKSYNMDLKSEQLKCKLCDENIENIVHLRIHLLSRLHRDREAQINFKLN